MLAELLPLGQPPGPGRDDEAGLPAAAQCRVDRRDDHVHVGDAAVGGPRLGAVQHPLAGGLIVDGPGPDRPDVAAGLGLGRAERAQLDVAGTAEHLRYPLADLLGGALPADRHRGQATAGQGQADARVAPEQFLEGDRGAEAGRLEPLAAEEVERVQADLGRLGQDRPGRLLALVPLRGGRAHHVAGELVHPVAHGPHVVGQVEGEAAAVLFAVAHRSPPRRGSLSYSRVVLLEAARTGLTVTIRRGCRAAGPPRPGGRSGRAGAGARPRLRAARNPRSRRTRSGG